MKNKRLILKGILVLAGSLLMSIVGAVGGVTYSFSSLSEAEILGIDAVGNGITFALIATVVGLVGIIGRFMPGCRRTHQVVAFFR